MQYSSYNISNAPSPVKKPNSKLSIFYVNDMHGNVEDMAGMVSLSDKFDQLNASNPNVDTIKLSAGDNFSGNDSTRNQLVMNLLTRMGIKASAVGNHEFDSNISTFYKYLNPSSPKFLASNAKTPDGSEFYNNVQKSTVMEINGTKYGLIGLLPFDLETVLGNNDKKMEGIRPESVEKSIDIVNEEAKKLTDSGIDRIILISHIGNDMDKKIASKLHGVDIIVGGHSHTEVEELNTGENLQNNADGNPILIVQTGENAKNVGVLDVEFDDKGNPIKATNDLIPTIREKSPVIEYLKNSTMGKSPEIGQIDAIDPLPVNRRITPCAWTNLMCDAFRAEMDVDIAFINAANTRKVPKTGVLTERDVSASTPMGNTILVKKMTEKEVVRAIKDALKMTFSNETGEPGIMHASGLSYIADTNANLHELSYVDKQGNKIQIDINNPSDKVYTVAYDSFVAKGTEYPVFVPETMTYKEIERTYDYDKDKCLIDYIKKSNQKLSIQDDGRIKILYNGTPVTATSGIKTVYEKQPEQPLSTPQPVQYYYAYNPYIMPYMTYMGAMQGYGSF